MDTNGNAVESREAEKAANLLRHAVHPSYYPLCSVHFDWDGTVVFAGNTLKDAKCTIRIKAPRNFLEFVWKKLCTYPIPEGKMVAITPGGKIEQADAGVFMLFPLALDCDGFAEVDPTSIMERLTSKGLALVDDANAISANIVWEANKMAGEEPCGVSAKFTTDFAEYSVLVLL